MIDRSPRAVAGRWAALLFCGAFWGLVIKALA